MLVGGLLALLGVLLCGRCCLRAVCGVYGGKCMTKVLVETRNGENGEVGDEGYSEFVLSAMRATPTIGMSFGGDEKRLVDLFSTIKEGWYLEDGVFASKLKGRMELKNLECSINFDARSSGSSRGKSMTILWV
jgi:hypothetical protein